MGIVAAPTVGWSTVNFPNPTIRAVAVASVVMIGNFGSVLASFLYPIANAPHHGKNVKIKRVKVLTFLPLNSPWKCLLLRMRRLGIHHQWSDRLPSLPC